MTKEVSSDSPETWQEADLLEKIRQQFDSSPYPKTPIELSPKNDANLLYIHNLITPYYLRNQQIIKPKETVILDAGCGSGYKTLVLAEANPGATIVGVDLSEKSIELARERLRFHSFPNVQFHALSLDDVAQLDMTFDYINCDEMLYLMPDLVQTLRTLKAVLKPTGILRANLHSLYQRQHFFRAQELFTWMGLMEGNPEDREIDVVLETMRAFKDEAPLKTQTWNPQQAQERPQEYVLMNYLFQGDKGYRIADLFEALEGAELEFICMVNQRDWDLMSVFQDPQALPEIWNMTLPQLSMEDRLQLFEFIAPVHRLIDFWCGHAVAPALRRNIEAPVWQVPQNWQPQDWQKVRVHLHPQLQTAAAKADLVEAIEQQRSFVLSRHLSASAPAGAQVLLSPYLAVSLLPLWDAPQTFPSLVRRILKVRPCDPITLKPTDAKRTNQELREALISLELTLHVLLERV